MDPQNLQFLGLPALAWVPLLPLIGALINLTMGRWFSRSTVHLFAIASVVASCGLACYLVFWPLLAEFKAGHGGAGIDQTVYTWIEVGTFKTQLAFHLDTLSAVMVLIITFVGSLIHIYSTGYMAHDPGYARYFGYLNLFMGAMLILVLGSSLPVMFIGWEGVGLCSFLLIGFWYENESFATAGRKAFIVNRIGDFCFLLGMFLLYWAVKSLDFADLKNATSAGSAYVSQDWSVNHAAVWGGGRLAAAAGILLFIGACGKSAQIPLYVWLPDAMAGPTPVSALIHAATMVTAGVYMVCRLSFLYSASLTALTVVAAVGLITALAAAFMAFAQTDMKKVLAYSTVSQLGFMFVAAGTGNWFAAIFHLTAHAFFKACLFLGAGSVMHGMEHGGSTTPGDITTMGGLRKHMPITRWTFMISCLAIAGIAPFSGFFSKDDILGGAWNLHVDPAVGAAWTMWFGKVLWGGLLIAALGTAFYMWRLYFLVFAGEERSEQAKKAHESPPSMTTPLIVLAIFATGLGVIGFPQLHAHLPGFMHAFSSWLQPSVVTDWYVAPTTPVVPMNLAIEADVSDITTYVLMGVALGIGAIGIGLAWMFYGRGPSPSLVKIVAGPPRPSVGFWQGLWYGIWSIFPPAYEASKHKLWVDEIYDALLVRPFRAVARGLYEIVDRFIIDTVAVNGVAFVVGLIGRLSRWFQNGQVQRYLAGVVIGAAAVFLVTDCHAKPTFEYKLSGDQLLLHAEPGAGVVGATAHLRWDIDGDGKPDVDANGKLITAPNLQVLWGNNVGGRVTLWVDDPVSHATITITQTIRTEEVKP